MPLFTTDIGVVLARRKAASMWVDVIWEADSVLADVPDTARGTALGGDESRALFYGGSVPLEAHTKETGHYRTNLMTGDAKLWVVTRSAPDGGLPEVIKVTADPHEGEAFTETGWDTVNVVPMPVSIAGELLSFIEEHHEEDIFHKRKRDRADPEALARGRKGPERDRFLRALKAEEEEHR